ncbi:MAG: hypothetical protein FWC75_03155 [Oscillospiraceae bacterium]|nr:hypothetical protein [Oscillospiraceae bacterium]
MIKIWGGSGKRIFRSKFSITGKLREDVKRAESAPKHAPDQQIVPEYPRSSMPDNVINYETLQQMYHDYQNTQFEAAAAVGDETSELSYSNKQKNLKFLTL